MQRPAAAATAFGDQGLKTRARRPFPPMLGPHEEVVDVATEASELHREPGLQPRVGLTSRRRGDHRFVGLNRRMVTRSPISIVIESSPNSTAPV